MFPKLMKKQQTTIATLMIEQAQSTDFLEFIADDESYVNMVAFFKAHPDDEDFDIFNGLHAEIDGKKAKKVVKQESESETEKKVSVKKAESETDDAEKKVSVKESESEDSDDAEKKVSVKKAVKQADSVDSLTKEMEKMDVENPKAVYTKTLHIIKKELSLVIKAIKPIEGGFTLYDMKKPMEMPEIGLIGVTTLQLTRLFGKPEESDDPEEDGFRFIYTVKLKGKVYEIYDRQDEEDSWDQIDKIEWYASSKGSMAALRAAFGVRIPYDADDFKDLTTKVEITTEMLENKGEMMKNECSDGEWSRGFYFDIGKKVYFVHDLGDCDGVFDSDDDIEWFVKGNGAVATLIKFLKA